MKNLFRYLQFSALVVAIILVCIWTKISQKSINLVHYQTDKNSALTLKNNPKNQQENELNNIQCFQLPLKSNQLNDLSNQLQFRSQPGNQKVFGKFLEQQNSQKNTIIYCNQFTHDYDNCKPVPRNKEALEEGFHVPGGWDWRAYLRYYPEVVVWSHGHIDEFTALKHYNEIGKFELRVARKLNVVLRYTTCGNIAEQQYSHISAITLAALLGAKLVIPPLFRKNEKNQTWEQFSQNELIDTEFLTSFWGQKGLTMDLNESRIQMPDFDHPESAYLMDFYEGFLEKQYIYINDLYRTTQPVLDVLYRIKKDALFYDMSARAQQNFKCLNGFVVDLPCTLFSLETETVQPLFSQVAKTLKFNKKIIDLANSVVEKLGEQFNAIHIDLNLNLEQIMEKYFKQIIQVGQKQNYDSNKVMYLACGKNQQQNQLIQEIQNYILENRLAINVQNQQQTLDQNIFDSLEVDVSEAVDLLVLLKSKYFIGLRQSSFSFYVSEFRKLQKDNKLYSELINFPELGNTEIIEKGGVLS